MHVLVLSCLFQVHSIDQKHHVCVIWAATTIIAIAIVFGFSSWSMSSISLFVVLDTMNIPPIKIRSEHIRTWSEDRSGRPPTSFTTPTLTGLRQATCSTPRMSERTMTTKATQISGYSSSALKRTTERRWVSSTGFLSMAPVSTAPIRYDDQLKELIFKKKWNRV